MSNKQSSVDILCQKLANKLGLQAITFYIDHQEEIAEAKAMHKEEIIKAWVGGKSCLNGEQYYNQTYGGNK